MTEKKNTSPAAKGALANHLQRCTACKVKNGRQGTPKWPMGSGEGSTPSTPSMKKIYNEEKKREKKKGENSGLLILLSFYHRNCDRLQLVPLRKYRRGVGV